MKQDVKSALLAARKIIADWLESEITSYARPESNAPKGAILHFGHYFHPDTINDVDALNSVRVHQAALKKIDAVLPRHGKSG